MNSLNTYIILLRGETVATATYRDGIMLTLTITSIIEKQILETMALLPAREKYLDNEYSMIGVVPVNDIKMHGYG